MSWIDTTQIPAGDRMAVIATDINKSFARFCVLLAEADRAQEWLADGSPNPTQWLDARFGIRPAMARRLTRVAKQLGDLPELSKRFDAGGLSLDAVELLAETATPETEQDLIDAAAGRDLNDIGRLTSRERPPTPDESIRNRAAQWMSTQWDLRRRRMRFAGELTGLRVRWSKTAW